LCCKRKRLHESHIIPKFVTDWLKKSSGTGFLRSSGMPNRRSQDGEKEQMLCSDCEALFNQWETPFATEIFHPLNTGKAMQFKYGSWLLKFAVSVSWRVLTSYEPKFLSEMSDPGKTLVTKALQTWKEFLLDLRPHPGSFEQHIMITDIIKSTHGIDSLPPNWNRFMTRGYHINMAHSEGHPLYIYTKMGRVTLLGFIGIEHPRYWIGTKIHVKEGVIGGSIKVPIQFLDYMKERANAVLNVQQRISEKQLEAISTTYRKDPDRAVASETFLALDQDVRMFGKNMVFGENDSKEKDPS
jgi:hypothetical protein